MLKKESDLTEHKSMKWDKRFGFIASISLVLVASLIAAALSAGYLHLSELGALYILGKTLILSYGFSALLIPLILLGASYVLLIKTSGKWKARVAFSAIPFFTVVFIEKVCRLILEKSFSFRIIESALTIFVGALVVAIELIVLGRINLFSRGKSEVSSDKSDKEKNPKEKNEEAKEKRDPFAGVFDSLGEGRATTLTQDEIAALTAFEETAKEELPVDKLEWKLPEKNSSESLVEESEEENVDASSQAKDTADFELPKSAETASEGEKAGEQITGGELAENETQKEVELGKFSEVFSDMDTDVEDSLLAENFEKGGELTRHVGIVREDGSEERVLLRSGTGLLRGKDVRAALQEAEDEVKKNFEKQNDEGEEFLSYGDESALILNNEKPVFKMKSDDENVSSNMTGGSSFYEKYTVSPSYSFLETSEVYTNKENDVETSHEVFESDLLEGDEEEAKNVVEEKELLFAKSAYSVPSDLLNEFEDDPYWVVDEKTEHGAKCLTETLKEFNISASVSDIKKGPVVTMYEILPAPGVKLSKIVSLQDNIALRMAASSVRIVAPIPGKAVVGIEVPNEKRSIVSFREIVEMTEAEFEDFEVPIILGKDILGKAEVLDLVKTPHLLIAGATGSGKSVCVNSMILSILYKRSPEKVRMILIDPKIVELKLYNDIPHLLTPVITEPKKAFQALQYCLCEMERRYSLLDALGVRDIKSYNKKIRSRHLLNEKLPYIVVIIDEFADLMATTGKELESAVSRLAAMSRAVGIHLVLATQRPSIDVITGLIKANIPTRIAFMVASKTDSRIIIDQSGAEMLLGKGDMLYCSAASPFAKRIQGTFVDDEEVERVVDYVKTLGEADYIDEEIFIDDEEDDHLSFAEDGSDPLYDEALDIVIKSGKASASYIQRRLKVGYNRAARIVEEMHERGIVGPPNGSKPRELLYVP